MTEQEISMRPCRIRHRGLSALVWHAEPPTAVFLHGGLLNAHAWDAVLARLDLPTVALDLPGHGRSARYADGDYALDRNAADVAALIRDRGWEQVAVVGHSRGGLIATRVAAAIEPAQLVLVDADPTRVPDPNRRMTMRATGRFDELVDDAQRMRPDLDRERVADGVRRGAVQRGDDLWEWNWDPRARGAESVEEARMGAQRLREITCPVTLIRGEFSRAITADSVERTERLLGRSVRVESVPSGHNPHSEIPEVLAALLADILGQ